MESFQALKSWLTEIKSSMPDDAIIQIVGAKSDLGTTSREVSLVRGALESSVIVFAIAC